MTRCIAQYRRPGVREQGDRIVECHLVDCHAGDHEEAGTGFTWSDEMAHAQADDETGWQQRVRAAGWVPLAEVLDAVWDIDAIQRWATRSIPLGAFIGNREIHDYLADRFGGKEEQ